MIGAPAGDRIDRWRDTALREGGRCRSWALRRIAFARGPRAAEALGLIALHAEDEQLRHDALAAVGALSEPAAVDAVCELAIASADERLHAVLSEAGHEPSDRGRRGLWLLLTGRFDRYAELDFDGALLRAAYRTADPGLRRRIAEQARAAGRLEWIRVATADVPGAPSHRLDEEQWRTTVRVLADTNRFDELWRLLPQAPLRWAARILVELGERGRQPIEENERVVFDGLFARARGCRAPLSARSIFGAPVFLDGGPILAMSPRGDLIATPLAEQFNDQGFAVRRLADGETLATFRQDPVSRCGQVLPHVEFSSDGGRIAAQIYGGDQPLRLWRTDDMTSPQLIPVPRCCRDADFAVLSDGVVLVSQWCSSEAHTPSVQMWNPALRSDRPVRTIDVSFGGYVSHSDRFAVTPDEKLLITSAHGRSSTDSPRFDRSRLSLWRLPSADPVGVLMEDGPRIDDLTVSADGRLLLSTGLDESRSWHLPSGIPAGGPWAGEYMGMSIMPDNRLLTRFGQIRRPFDLQRADGLAAAQGEVGWPRAVSPDGTLLVAGLVSSGIAVRHLPEGASAGELDGDGTKYAGGTRNPSHLRFTPSGVLVASHWEKIMLWHPRPALAGTVPVEAVSPPEVHTLRVALAGCPASDRAWVDLLEALVMWRRRHDIVVSSTGTTGVPTNTDIEVDR